MKVAVAVNKGMQAAKLLQQQKIQHLTMFNTG